jgi:hypothetical protein
MFELSEIWRTSMHEGQGFLQKVRIYALSDTKIWDPVNWSDWAIHWKKQHDALDSRAKEHSAAILAERGHNRLLQSSASIPRFQTSSRSSSTSFSPVASKS